MPRRWTNTDQYPGMSGRAAQSLRDELREQWAWRKRDHALSQFRQTYNLETTS